MKRLSIAVAAGLFIGGLAGSSATAASITDDSHVLGGSIVDETSHVTIRESNGWTTFEYKADLPGAERKVYHGQRDGEGCVFSGSRTMSGADATVSEEREVGHYLEDCVLVTEVGDREVGDVDATEPSDGLTARDVADPVVMDASSEGFAPRATRSAWHRTRYLDPPGATVTRTTSNVTWNYSGGCVTSSSGHTANHYWLGPTGWSKTSSYAQASRTCAAALTHGYAYYRNGSFCVGQPATYTQFSPVTIRGNANGSYTASWKTSKSGGCSSWLSFQSHAGLG